MKKQSEKQKQLKNYFPVAVEPELTGEGSQLNNSLSSYCDETDKDCDMSGLSPSPLFIPKTTGGARSDETEKHGDMHGDASSGQVFH